MAKCIEYAIIFALVCGSVTANQHLVCKTMQDVFADDSATESTNHIRRLQGPPGKSGSPGPPGIRGQPGPSGPPAIIDYKRIDRVIAEKMASAVANLNLKVSDVERNFTEAVAETNLRLAELESFRRQREGKLCRAKRGFYYRNKCYTVIYSRGMSYDGAVAECAKTGALLAEIHDRAQQDELQNFALSTKPSGQLYRNLWIGMEYQRSTSSLLYRSGISIPTRQFQWVGRIPLGPGSHIIMTVQNDGDYSLYGLWNNNPLFTHGVMCEKDLQSLPVSQH